jgi:MFS transporter, PHS family, inorganic phosphate transporter
MYGIELMIIIVATIGTALCGTGYSISLAGTIMFWRVIMGIGIGGDYPLSAIITSEFATKKRRGAMMAAVFAMQGFGILAAAIAALVVLAAFKNSILVDTMNIDYCWRLVLGFGAVPGLLALYFRLTIPETPRYTMDVEHNVDKASEDITSYLKKDGDIKNESNAVENRVYAPKSSWADFKNYFGQWKNGKVLLGTAMSWFALDIAFYGIGLNNGSILKAIGYADSHDPDHNKAAFVSLYNMAVGNIIITAMGTVPGYWVTVLFVDKWGRKPIQLMGFAVLTVIFIIMGAAFDQLKTHSVPAFIVLFVLLQVFIFINYCTYIYI